MSLILIIDDSSFQRRMIKKDIAAEGHEIIEAGNGQEGLEMIASHAPECVFLDLLMPEMDGPTVLENLRDQESEIPVIVLTADIQESIKERCLELGAITVINKPLKTDELRAALVQALGTPEGVEAAVEDVETTEVETTNIMNTTEEVDV